MNWGKALASSLIVFAGLMAFFVVKAGQNPEALVTERYYEQELKYQQRIDDAARARTLSSAVAMEIAAGGVRLTFPAEMNGQSITGELTLLCTNDPAGDRTLVVRTANGTYLSGLSGARSGLYHAQLEWAVAGVNYYTERKLIVP